MSPRSLVVVPTYNEATTIERVVARTLEVTDDTDLLVVDDGSPDGTGRIVAGLAANEPRLDVLHRDGKRGLGPAYRAGLGRGMDAGYDVLVEMDADLSHNPGDLPRLIGATDRADLVLGSRYVPGGHIRNWPWYRLALSSLGNRYVRVVTGVPVRDATSGFRAYRREVLEAIGLRGLASDGYAFQLETVLRTWRAGFAVAELPITFVERRAGSSKISRRIVVEALWRVLVWASSGPRRPATTHPRSVTAHADTGR